LRIKSYFDSSIQTAMRQARHEFGADVMLVTSRVASPEFRYLGDFEVVFAVDDNETGPKAESLPQPDHSTSVFEEQYRQQLASAVISIGGAREAAVSGIYSLLVDLGLELAVVESLVALIRSCSPRFADRQTSARFARERILSSTAGESAADHIVPPIPEHTQDWSQNVTPSKRAPDPGGTTPGGLRLSEETAPAASPPPAWIDSTTLSDELRPPAPPPSGIAPIEPHAGIEEASIPAPPIEMPTGGERAEFPATGHKSYRPLRAPRIRPPSAVALILVALGAYGVIRRSGS